MPLLTAALVALVLAQTPTPPSQPPQTAAPAAQRLRVFLDCDCFREYIRTEVTFVDYVRDRADADVHVLGESRETGGSGREYTLQFIELGRLDGFDLGLRALTAASDTEDTRRRAVESVLTSGVLVYLAKAEIPGQLSIDVDAGGSRRPAPADDPWNFWVYSLRANTEFQAEESNRELEWGVSASADRVTEHWKMSFGLRADQTREEFDLDEDDPVESRRHSREFDFLVVKSFGPHWSAGVRGETGSSSFENMRFQVVAAPAVEYSVFPYQDYARRQLTATYAIRPRHNRYYEETLFGRLRETRVRHELDLRFDRRERGGTLEFGVELQSGYEYRFDVSFIYTFGSIFNNVVNPRFGGGDDFRRN